MSDNKGGGAGSEESKEAAVDIILFFLSTKTCRLYIIPWFHIQRERFSCFLPFRAQYPIFQQLLRLSALSLTREGLLRLLYCDVNFAV